MTMNWRRVAAARAAATRRCALICLALALGLSLAEGSAQTAKYPDKPVKILVGFSAGGGTDVVGEDPCAEDVRRPRPDGCGREPVRAQAA